MIGRSINTKSQSWGTPKKYISPIKEFFGIINLDPCSNEFSIVNAEVEFKLPQDGLIEEWNYKNIYVNPPYGLDRERRTRIKDWISKCYESYINYNSEIIALIPVAINTDHWKKFIYKKANSICFLSDTRLKFLENGEISKKGAPMACCLIYWGNNFDKFYRIFKKYGEVFKITTDETCNPSNL